MIKTNIKTMKNGKARKISLVPMSKQENLADLFLIFSDRLQMRPKRCHLSDHSEMRPLGNLVNFIKWLP